MTVSALVMTAAFLAAPQTLDDPRPPVTGVPAPAASADVTPDAQQQPEPRSRQVTERRRAVGVGGQLGVSNRGAGGGARFFFSDRLGVNLNLSWYRNGSAYRSQPQQGSTFAALPSFIYMLTDPDDTKDVDIRPYVGGGVNYVRSTRPVTTTGAGATLQQRAGTGGQVFGGVEMTFREARFMTISAEGIYYHLPVSYVNSSVVGGFNYLLAFHFFVR